MSLCQIHIHVAVGEKRALSDSFRALKENKMSRVLISSCLSHFVRSHILDAAIMSDLVFTLVVNFKTYALSSSNLREKALEGGTLVLAKRVRKYLLELPF